MVVPKKGVGLFQLPSLGNRRDCQEEDAFPTPPLQVVVPVLTGSGATQLLWGWNLNKICVPSLNGKTETRERFCPHPHTSGGYQVWKDPSGRIPA